MQNFTFTKFHGIFTYRYSRHDKRSKLPGWILSHLHDAHLNLSTDMALHIAREVCFASLVSITCGLKLESSGNCGLEVSKNKLSCKDMLLPMALQKLGCTCTNDSVPFYPTHEIPLKQLPWFSGSHMDFVSILASRFPQGWQNLACCLLVFVFSQ